MYPKLKRGFPLEKYENMGTNTYIHVHMMNICKPYLLKALFISEQLQVLMEFQMMLLKEAIEGGLHVSELSKEPKKHSDLATDLIHCKALSNVFEVCNKTTRL